MAVYTRDTALMFDVTPAKWADARTPVLAAVIAMLVEEFPISEIRATRTQLVVALSVDHREVKDGSMAVLRASLQDCVRRAAAT